MTDIKKEEKRTVAITGAAGLGPRDCTCVRRQGISRIRDCLEARRDRRPQGGVRRCRQPHDLRHHRRGRGRRVGTGSGRPNQWRAYSERRHAHAWSARGVETRRHQARIQRHVFAALPVTNAFLPALRKQRGRIVYISTWTASLPLPSNGPSGASKAALEVIATIHCAELKPFGVEVVVAAPGNMRTGGPALVAEGLRKIAHDFTDEQRKLYGGSFGAFANRLNAMQGGGISAADAAAHVVEIAEETPAPIKAGVGEEAEEILRYVRETPPAKQDIRRLEMVGRRARLRPKTTTLDRKEQAMLVLVDPNDARAVNKDTILAMYDLLINTKKPMKAGVGPVYIQHNPLLVISAPPGSSRKSPPNVRTPASSSTRSSPSATMSGRT
jgi:NAD(P)-dependent dehydrogenase (short-subunit alcohol dehydrogenase family)